MWKSTKMGAYATSDLKSDNKGEPRKNTYFSLLCLVFETIDCWKVRCLSLHRFCNVPLSVVTW